MPSQSNDTRTKAFHDKGWHKFSYDAGIAEWIIQSKDAVYATTTAPENEPWIRCNGTWFVGVNALANTPAGAVDGGKNLTGSAMDFISNHLHLPNVKLDRGQVSICYPGYPQQSTDETDASYNFRLKYDAAHIDGLLPEGPDRRRHLREAHAFILGIPMDEVTQDTAPLVVWEGSHTLAAETFQSAYANISPQDWGQVDVTEIYQELRRKIFKNCKKRIITAKLGETYILHNLTLHGIAPWTSTKLQPEGRMVVYFRPELSDITKWLQIR